MAMRFAGSPGSITAEETVLKDTDTPITIVIDKFNYVFLTLEQARSLWHELGAVLQSLDTTPQEQAGYVWCNEDSRYEHPDMHGLRSDSIRNLEDLRGLPHSSDLEPHPSNPRR